MSGDDFSKYPITIGEARLSGDAAKWSPREALISLLREIDEGELDPEAIIIGMMTRDKETPSATRVRYRVSSPDAIVTLGILEMIRVNYERDINADR